jgi:hemerythrin-like domain-containing protein
MDALTRAAREHEQIQERMTFFQKSFPIISAKKDYGQLAVLGGFFNEYVMAHFHFEETEVFPLLLEWGRPEEKALVRVLQKEHSQILPLVEKFFSRLDQVLPTSGQEQIDELFSIGREIINQTLLHARKEDENLFPAMKRHFHGKTGL